jgi:hypothetical protein
VQISRNSQQNQTTEKARLFRCGNPLHIGDVIYGYRPEAVIASDGAEGAKCGTGHSHAVALAAKHLKWPTTLVTAQ